MKRPGAMAKIPGVAPSTRTFLPRCKPDDVARTAALCGGAHRDLVHREAGVAKPFGK